MILYCSYEETRALRRGAEVFLSGSQESGTVLAPPVALASVENLAARLEGDLSVGTYWEMQDVEAALEAIVLTLLGDMDRLVIATHPAGEESINAYFDYAHATTVLTRARELKTEMAALIELMTGAPVNEASARSVSLPD